MAESSGLRVGEQKIDVGRERGSEARQVTEIYAHSSTLDDADPRRDPHAELAALVDPTVRAAIPCGVALTTYGTLARHAHRPMIDDRRRASSLLQVDAIAAPLCVTCGGGCTDPAHGLRARHRRADRRQ
jgi:hypothetical protein